ncbi:NHLP bacteriocin export ABC transporter permease/ATPase subunit [Fischerella thermalis]|uniref:NHLP bacteriocin export ABC transporter permease/ATPase subunit n=1 Tax=Fischerella thermalis CCMEE 5318 TaxID=2019666 RepID=A0A2N6L3N3_9CYAN|nr:NHLP bacteriocin export ABC transporter permease/ATPase subunit [Fischerella thermalis]PMB14638.1 NHLP bacteriocin export ABC transporter permease/ATPase subunit [Fischerella thermalis CCMEE 5318]
MLEQISYVIPQGQEYILKGNQPILLNDPETVWLIKSGSMALFAIAVKDGVPEGSRRYLLTLGDGEAMFSTIPSQYEQQRQILAVSMEETELLKMSKADFNRLIANKDGEAVSLVDGWVTQLGLALSEITPPKMPVKLEGINFFSLNKGDIFQPQPGTVSWVEIQEGYVRWLGIEELDIYPSSGILPLSADMWLQADSMVELATSETSDLQDGDRLLKSLSQLTTYFLQGIELLEQSEITAELRRFQERERLNYQVMQEALGELSSVLEVRKSAFPSETKSVDNSDQALMIAAGAVGRALGIKICPPAQSEDLRRVAEPLEAIARASRVRMRRISLADKWWKKDSGPVLTYTKDDHPVAILPISDNRYEIFDPLERTRTRVDERSAANLAPTGYVFYRPFPDTKFKIQDLLQFALRGHFKELIYIMLAGVITTVLGMLTPQATAILIDNAIPDANRGLLTQIGLGLLAVTFGQTMFELTQAFAIIRLQTFAESSTQAAVWDRLLNLQASFFRQYSVGDLKSRVSSISQIHQKLSSTVIKSIFSSFFSLLNLGLLFYYSATLALLACFVAVVNIGITLFSGILTVQKFRPLLELEGQIFGVMVQLINGVSKIRVSGAESRAFAYWSRQYTHQLKLMLRTQSIEDGVTFITKVLPPLTNALLFWVAASMIQDSPEGGGLSTGIFLAFNAAFGSFIGGATSLSTTVVDIMRVLPMWKRAEPILTAIPEITASKTDPGRLSGKLLVDHVVFRYRDDGPLTLDDVTIKAEPGEYIALVGPSGSGKSTLFRLLLGFDHPESGTIYYDGQDLAGLDVNAVRRQLGVVMQNSRMMSGSIFDNIASGAMITMEEAWDAARASGLADDIETMPMGMHTVVSEGATNLSGGQRQRLLIARALVLKPRILLFDEATSALDNRTQAIVSESLERLQVTRIAIAHRLSTIRNAHRIYVLQGGRVVQQGSFDELAQQQGLFAQLMARQML